jgi:subtilisin family serine protease
MKSPLRPLFSLILFAGFALAGTVSKDFQATNPLTPVRVIVQMKTPTSQPALNQMRAAGGSLQRQFSHFPKTVVVTLPAGAVKLLAQLPFVQYVSPVRSVKKHLDLTTATVGADLARQYGFTGQGVGVAVIDSGIDTTNTDLAGRVVYSEDFTGTGVTTDRYGHGTHVAGIVGASGANSGGKFHGIAPGREPDQPARA